MRWHCTQKVRIRVRAITMLTPIYQLLPPFPLEIPTFPFRISN